MEVGTRRTCPFWNRGWYRWNTKILYMLDIGQLVHCMDEFRGNIYHTNWDLNNVFLPKDEVWL
jgi:hypothetical protein